MHNQKICFYNDESLLSEQLLCMEIMYDFNQTRPSEVNQREDLLEQLFAELGEGCYVEPPLRASWGKHTHLGDCVYANQASAK